MQVLCCHLWREQRLQTLASVFPMSWPAASTRSRLYLLLSVCLLLPPRARGATEVAGVSIVDRWSGVDGLGLLVQAAGGNYTDGTAAVRSGGAPWEGKTLFMLGGFYTEDAQLRAAMTAARDRLADWIAAGGTVVCLSQADQTEAVVAWLPAGLAARRADLDYGSVTVMKPEHPLMKPLGRQPDEVLSDWRYKSWPSVWESFETHAGMAIIAAATEHGRSPAILEGAYGDGRVLLMALAPDKAMALADTTQHTRDGALALARSILAYAELVRAGQAPPVVPDPVWNPVTVTVQGGVFEDLDADGARDPGEPGRGGAWVSSGLESVATASDGTFTLRVDTGLSPFVWVSLPPGWLPVGRPWRHIGQTDETGCWLPLRSWPEGPTPGAQLSFVQTTDIHVADAATQQVFLQDIATINRLALPGRAPAFVVETGDLVNSGNNLDSFALYRDAIQRYAIPHFPGVGNHDYSSTSDRRAHYQDHVGPTFYSWSAGDYHFVMLDSVDSEHRGQQQAWLEADLDRLEPGRRVVVFQHYLPDAALLTLLGRRAAVLAVLSGHWHGNKVRRHGTLLDINTPCLRYGGIDRTPGGFRVVTLRDGTVALDYRLGGIEQRMQPAGVQAGGGVLDIGRILISAYDSTTDVLRMTAVLPGAAPVTLERVTDWLWSGALPAAAGARAAEELLVRAEDTAGRTWERGFAVQAGAAPVPRYRPGSGWEQLQGGPDRAGWRETGPEPPLELAWVRWTGGSGALAGPIVAAGVTWVPVEVRRALEDCAVVGLAMADGGERFRFDVEAPVKNAAAWSDGRLVAVDVNGKVYGWYVNDTRAAASGARAPAWEIAGSARLWTRQLGDPVATSRWETSAPLVVGDRVWAGTSTAVHCLGLADGRVLWKAAAWGSDWWPNQYPAPAWIEGDTEMVSHSCEDGVNTVSASSGATRWSVMGSASEARPFAVRGEALYGVLDRQLVSVRAADGGERWRLASPAAGDGGSMPAVGPGVVCVGTADGALIAVESDTGRLRWRVTTGTAITSPVPYQRGGASVNAAPVITGSYVYVAAADGTVRAHTLDTGALVWSFQTGVPLLANMAMDGNALVAVGTDGSVWCFLSTQE